MLRVALLVECRPVHRKITSSIIGEDTSQVSCLDAQGLGGGGHAEGSCSVFLSLPLINILSKVKQKTHRKYISI